MSYVLRLGKLEPNKIRGRLIENPAYSLDHEPHTGWSIADWEPIRWTRENSEKNFFAAMEKDIRKNGIRVPACGYSFESGVYIKTGMTRAYFARQFGLLLPIILSDHVGRFADWEEVPRDPEVIKRLLGSDPIVLEFTKYGMHYGMLADRNNYPRT